VDLLAIETSCDETAAAVIRDGRQILSNVVASQIDIHRQFGGVVPEVASRQHVLSMIPVVEEAMQSAGTTWKDLDAIAVTSGPGLAGSLMVGLNAAKGIAYAQDLPLLGINHLEGHIYANWLVPGASGAQDLPSEPRFPALCLVVSGGHTDLVVMRGHGQFMRVGSTRDDAAGEAFDKVSRLLDLGFPGGPAIQHAAESVKKAALRLPRAWLRGSWDFSFSGLKTAVVHVMRDGDHPPVEHVAAAFQDSVVDVLTAKTCKLASEIDAKEILLAGGVAANSVLRTTLVERSPVPVRAPPPNLCTDNGAMIGACAYYRYELGERADLSLDIFPGMHFLEDARATFRRPAATATAN
jgi:N6-L-threonylcarbamoyladenine synthase